MSDAPQNPNQKEILVADDNPASLQLLTGILTGYGYRVRPAATGTLALRSVATKAPDLILLDVKMPDLDGFEVCRRLASASPGRRIPVIFVSAMNDATDKVRGFAAGGVDYITKPYIAEEILARIQMHLRLRDLTERLEDSVRARTEELMRANEALLKEISERRQAEAALSISEQRWRTLFEQAAVGVAEVDTATGRFIQMNRRFCEIVGHTADDLLQTDFQSITYPDDLPVGLENMRRLRAGDVADFTLEKRYVKENGDPVWTTITVSPLWHKGEDPTHHVAFVEDITERKRHEDKAKQLQDQLLQAQKMESVGRLAGGVAHDFNNMLGVIIGRVELAMGHAQPDTKLHKCLLEIRKAADRSAALTRQLLAFARKQMVMPRVIDLNETVGATLEMLRRLINEETDLQWLPGGSLVPVKIDPVQIDQILANLCVNARDAIAGVGRITIATRTAVFDDADAARFADLAPGAYAVLQVSDTGCGMSPETRSRLFEPFFTTKGVGQGTGLGLATVYGIVKQNDGFIDVESTPDQGSTFTIYLPAHRGETDAPCADSATSAPRTGSETILLVEDEPALLDLTRGMLEDLGYCVITAATPNEAIRAAKERGNEIHLLLTDVVMPEMNGRDLTNAIQPLCPHARCLFMSGYTADAIAQHGVLDDGVCFLQKPFTLADLSEKVREALET